MFSTTDRRRFLASAFVASGLGSSSGQSQTGAASPEDSEEISFAHSGRYNIRDEDHFGIVNGHITVGVNYRDIGGLSGLYAPPYASTDFLLEVRVSGRPVPTSDYSWAPIEVRRKGRAGDIEVASETVLLHGRRGGIVRITLTNRGSAVSEVPLQFNITGSFDRVDLWGFPRPQTQKQPTTATAESNYVVRANQAGGFAVASDAPGRRWEPWSSHWETRLRLTPGGSQVVHTT
ncbi:MAG: hypothetical protein ACRD7E_02140, partial [Bryobacteraceae bacterium]